MVSLTICIFTHNRAYYLKKLLDSIENNIAQLTPNSGIVDIVVSDNCSTDFTKTLVNDYKFILPIKYHCNNSNRGADENVRISASLARGEYIWFMADDDILVDGAISYLLNFLKINSEVFYVFYPRLLADIDGFILSREQQPRDINKDLIFESGQELFCSLHGQMPGVLLFVSSNIIKRSVWNEYARKYPADVAGWSHAKPILHSIFNKKCAILSKPGVVCRLENARESQSIVWFDNYISVFLFAKHIGYSSDICVLTINRIVDVSQKSFVLDKMNGKRTDSISECLSKLGCRDLIKRRSIWMWLSYLPVYILRLGLPVYRLRKTLRY